MVELVERASVAGEEERDSDDGPPVAHLAPVGPDGSRAALCGAEILGIHVGNADYVLCAECDLLSQTHPRYSREPPRSWGWGTTRASYEARTRGAAMDELTLLHQPLKQTYEESRLLVQRLLQMAVEQPERQEEILGYLYEGERRWLVVYEPELVESD